MEGTPARAHTCAETDGAADTHRETPPCQAPPAAWLTHTRGGHARRDLFSSFVLPLSLKEADFRWWQNRRAPASRRLAA